MDPNRNPAPPAADHQLLPRSTSLERQRRRPMWGCVKWIGYAILGLFLILGISVWWLYYYGIGTQRFGRYVANKIETNLEARLGRQITIGRVRIIRGDPIRVVLENLTVSNAPGATRRHFAYVREIEIAGGIESFRNRLIRVGRVDVRGAHIFYEVFPQGHALAHNWPRWRRSAPRRYQITRLDINKLLVHDAAFDFLDRRHDIHAVVRGLDADVDPTFRSGIYQGVANSPLGSVRIKDFEPFHLNLRGAFHYRPGSLALNSVALRGDGIDAFIGGRIDPLSDAVYNLQINARTELQTVRQIFRVARPLDGELALTGRMRGKRGNFILDADFRIPELTADTYELSDLRGTTRITDERLTVDLESAQYGGGSLDADYILAQYSEPYPMSVDLRYNRVSIEKLFADWNVQNTGLRGGATGALHYEWFKDDLLSGTGQGDATLNRGAVAFGNARYPIAVGGRTRFALNRGAITFAPSTLETPRSSVAFNGTLLIEDLIADLRVRIDSRDFAELDRIGFNFARSAGKADYELLGLGGSGTITGVVRGEIGEPLVTATIVASGTEYNDVALGASNIELRYDGPRGVLRFERATFRDRDATMVLTGTISFPDRGPSPVFDLTVDAGGWPVERALEVVELDLAISGIGTGRLRVEGSPDNGRVTFDDLRITRNASRLNLNGLVAWAPGEGNLTFDLDLAADSFPVGELLAFFDITNIPVTGALTGTLHLEGPKAALAGAGSVTIREGTVSGEPVDVATADLLFEKGRLRATHVDVRSPAGTITGEAELDLATERFSYVIKSSELDVSRLRAFQALNRLFGGRLRITSSGAGTFDQPEIVVEATLIDGTVQGQQLPAGEPPPTFYFATREGKLVIRGAAFNAFTITGDGIIAPDGSLDGAVRLEVSDVGRMIRLFSPQSEFPASGSLVADLDLGGKISPLEAIEILGTIPTLDILVSEHRVTATEPIRFALANGRVEIQSYRVVTDGSEFSAEGYVSLVGRREININVSGLVEAALAQLLTPDVRAEGHINLAVGVTGTVDSPRVQGTAEIQDAQVRLAGFPQLIDDIKGTLEFEGDTLRLDSLTATLGGGTIVAGGSVTLDGLKPQIVRLNVTGSDVSIRYFEGLTLDGDVSLVLTGDVNRMLLAGEVTVDRAVYYRDIDLGAQILSLIVERSALVPEIAAGWQENIILDIAVRAPDTLAVTNNLADVTGSADVTLTGSLANPVVLGTVDIDEGGRVRFQDVDYRVVRGSISFQNPFQTDPFFDITAEARRSQYELTINLTGTPGRIKPSITTDPPTSDVTLFSLIGVNLPSDGNQRMDLQSLQNFSQSIVVQGISGFFGTRILPFADAVRLEGLLNQTEPSVTFEKQINEDVRAIVTYYTSSRGDSDHRNVDVVVEWQVTPDWVLLFTRDSSNEDVVLINAVNARFRRRYEGRWRW